MTVSDEGSPSTAPDAVRSKSPLRQAWEGWPGRILRVIFMVLPLVWLSGRTDWSKVLDRAGRVGFKTMLLAQLALLASTAAGAVRWSFLMRAFGAKPETIPSFPVLLRHYLVGLYYSILPSGLAGDAVRGVRVAHCYPKPSDSYVVLFVERLCGLIALLGIFAIAAVFVPVKSQGLLVFALELGIFVSLLFAIASVGLPWLMQRSERLRTLVERVPVAGRFLANMPVPRSGPRFVVALLISLVCQYLAVVCVWLMIAQLSPAATLAVCSRIVPPLILVTYIPLTPGGLGQREVAFVKFFAVAGVGAEEATATSLLMFTQLMGLALQGGVVLLFERLMQRRSR